MHRKGWGTCRSPKSYNLSLDCPPRLALFKMADKISMSQRALPKVTSQRYISSQRYIPNNVTLKKRQKPSAFYNRCQPSAAPCTEIRCGVRKLKNKVAVLAFFDLQKGSVTITRIIEQPTLLTKSTINCPCCAGLSKIS